MLGYIGFLMFLLGAGGMDSPNRTVPVIMIIVGLAFVGISALIEKSHCTHRPK